MRVLFRPLTLGLAVLALAPRLAAQETSPAPAPSSRTSETGTLSRDGQGARPRIGLALGGGSARGFAHIGVLEWLDEHRIPIDYIAGTSMGGLVAGTYATGMSPEEVRAMMKEVDWDLMFLADSPFEYKTFRRKQDRRAYPSLVEFGLKGGFRLPSGLNPGQQVALLLDHIALPYYRMTSFDELPTPYRCVATDLKQAEAVVLGRGSLSQAMRATMAIPGVFTPVNFENWLLVDGGALNNVPANVVREMGADVVVSVSVGADAVGEQEQRDAQASLFALLGRTIDTMMTGAVRDALKNSDIVVDPDLRGLTSMDWRRSGELADRGFQAAEAVRDKLLAYQMSEADYAAFAAERDRKRRRELPVPTAVIVRGGTPSDEAFVKAQLAPHVGRPLDEPALIRSILSVTGTDKYEYLTYRFTEEAGGAALVIGVRPKSYGPPFLNLSLELSNVDSSTFSVTLGGRVTSYDVTTAGSELRLDFAVGTRDGAAAELYQPFGRLGLFAAPRGYFLRSGRNGYADEAWVAEYRVKRVGAGVDIGWTSGRRAEIRLGADIAEMDGSLRVGNPLLPEVSGAEKLARLQFVFDGQNSFIVPSRGVYTRNVLRRFFSTADPTSQNPDVVFTDVEQFWQAETITTFFHQLSDRGRLFVLGAAGTSFHEDPQVNDFSLGGPLRLGAFNNDELRASNYLLATAGYLHTLARLPDVLGGNVYLGGWLENGSAADDWTDATWRTNASVGVLMESLIGPVFMGGSVGFDGRGRFYVSVGPLFR